VDSELSRRAGSAVTKILSRFEEQVTHVEIHLSDVNSDTLRTQDKRCLMEAGPAGLDPIAVTNLAPTWKTRLTFKVSYIRETAKSD
jgi:hypothetical protein